jgi:hypothetical protein
MCVQWLEQYCYSCTVAKLNTNLEGMILKIGLENIAKLLF